MDWAKGVAGSILLALLGFVLTYANNLRIDQRKDRLARLNQQLSDFYGPLFAIAKAADISWRAFREKYRPGPFWDDPPPSTEDEAAWRLWMTEVFMPLNLRMEAIIVEKADLLDEPEMPICLLNVVAHVAAYKTVLRRWETGDFSEHKSLLNFPSEDLLNYAEKAFRLLKTEQTRLLGLGRVGGARLARQTVRGALPGRESAVLSILSSTARRGQGSNSAGPREFGYPVASAGVRGAIPGYDR